MKNFGVKTNHSVAQQTLLNELLRSRGFSMNEITANEKCKRYDYIYYNEDRSGWFFTNYIDSKFELLELGDFINKSVGIYPQLYINEHKVEFNKGNIKVGCTTVTNEQVRKIVSKLID